MKNESDVLISVRPKYARQIFEGEKTVELRKRRPNIARGAKVWIYTTSPVAALQGYACLVRVISDKPSSIWANLGREAAISKSEFDAYFSGCDVAHALVLSGIRVLDHPLPLENIKRLVRGFHPPQFFCRLNGAATSMRLSRRTSHTPGVSLGKAGSALSRG
ncbi:MAG: ASCH domain-containing protein [Pseudolabrys sp.]